MKRDDLIKYLNNYFEIEKYLDKDPYHIGLIIEGKEEINSVIGSVNITKNLVNFAIENNFDLIISHHSLFSKKNFSIKKSLKEMIRELIKYNINVYSIHFPLDYHDEIGNWKLLLELLEYEEYEFYKEIYTLYLKLKKETNIGYILSKFPKKIKFYPFSKKVRVKELIFCNGGCSNYLLKFLYSYKDVDLVIVGELNLDLYLYCKENEINLLELGHYYSESYGIKKLLEKLKEFNLYTYYFEEEIEK